MDKKSITIDGTTYVKQDSPADTGPSKEEIEAAEKFCEESRKRSTIFAVAMGMVLGLLFSSFGFGFAMFFVAKLLYSIIIYSKHKNKFSKEVWDALPAAPRGKFQERNEYFESFYDPLQRHRPGNIYHRD